MAAVSQSTTTLIGGISQQPDPQKLPGQVRDAVNVQLNPTFGCEKRPASKYINKLADDIPNGVNQVKWFTIFRDSKEKYVACIYRDGGTVLRVWDAINGVERTVTINPDSLEYLDNTSPTAYSNIAINDFTLLANPDKQPTMSAANDEERDDECLIVVNQIAYNTTYTINFLKDGDEVEPVKIYSASSLAVTPSTFEVLGDGGACGLAASQIFTKDNGDKTGLSFELVTNCQPTQVSKETARDPYPTSIGYVRNINSSFDSWAREWLGNADEYGNGSYLYITEVARDSNDSSRYLTATVEVRSDDGDWTFSKASIVSYNQDASWSKGNRVKIQGRNNNYRELVLEVSATQTPDPTISYDYKSVYRTQVRLKNGGQNWRVGDAVTVNMGGKDYTVRVQTETFGYGFKSDASVSYTSPATVEAGGTLDIGDIVGSLTTGIIGLDNFDATPIGNVIHVTRTDGRPFNIQAVGGSTEKAMYALKGSVNDVSLLPTQGVDGVILMVRNSENSEADDYFVRFTVDEGDIPGQGSWEETVKPGIPTNLNPSSMPQALIRNADGTFTVRPLSPEYDEVLSWAGRGVGDEKTNPDPSFVGRGISGMFFFMNRLGFLSEDAVIMSQPGDYFNFFVGSAIAVSDADPIDMTAASERPSFLKAAIGVPRGALLFAENAQYMLATQDVAFGPSTAKISKIAEYSYTSDIPPLETGVSLMFHTESATFSKVFEMAIPNADGGRPQVADITRIIPEFIPPNIKWSAANANNNQVFFGTGDKNVYNFSFFNVGNERSMSGWTKWRFNHKVRFMDYFQDRAYIVQYNQDNNSYFLTQMDVLDNPGTSTINAAGREFTPRLDCLLSKDQLEATETEDNVTYIVPDSVPFIVEDLGERKPLMIVFGNSGDSTYYRELILEENGGVFTFTLEKEEAQEYFSIGLDYRMMVELPSFYVLQDKKADRNNVPIIETVQMHMYLSGRYGGILKRLGYHDQFLDLEAKRADVYLADSNPINELGVTEIPLFCKGDIATLQLTSITPLPSAFTGYGWKGHYNNRGISNLA